ncbi:MAG TPA: HD domain-containing protein [Candidatus Omnitrophota bacterium]|nr:HD domain-containing protein [Candidatus Omnitrophota bacterium]
MSIDYKKALETASKSMIRVHDPDKLIKMIVRMIVQKVNVSHANILLHNKAKQCYILTVSRGPRGLKVPTGFTKMDEANPLIRLFTERDTNRQTKAELLFGDNGVSYSKGKKFLDIVTNPEFNQLLRDALYQMEIFETVLCIPSYFVDELIGILLLGRKLNDAEFDKDEIDFFTALASDVAMAINNAQTFKQLQQAFVDLKTELDRNKKLFLSITDAMAAAIDAKDHYTHGHTTRVKDVSHLICEKLAHKKTPGVNPKFREHVDIASVLHDIGKIGIPEAILNKQGPLTPEEFKIIKDHPSIGENILKSIEGLEDCLLAVKYHHERYDGTGYPEGLKGDQIPLIAAIICVADAYDAMVSDRPYRKGLPKEKAITEIVTLAGKQFHPEISAIMHELYQEGKV